MDSCAGQSQKTPIKILCSRGHSMPAGRQRTKCFGGNSYIQDVFWKTVPDFTREIKYLLHFSQLPTRVLIIAQVFLVSDEDDGNIGTEVFYLWCPLLRNVFCVKKTTKSFVRRGSTFGLAHFNGIWKQVSSISDKRDKKMAGEGHSYLLWVKPRDRWNSFHFRPFAQTVASKSKSHIAQFILFCLWTQTRSGFWGHSKASGA